MDRISGLPDELLVKILSFLPPKVSVSTSVLSKRWRNLCMWVTNLEFDDSQTKPAECHELRLFILRILRSHRPLIIKSLGFKLRTDLFRTDITRWVEIAVSRGICELSIYYSFLENHPTMLPSNLYTSKSLATLKLQGHILVAVPLTVCLSSLKRLHLRHVTYLDDHTLQLLLSNSHVLEDLVFEKHDHYYHAEMVSELPSSLYTRKSLVTLKLDGKILVDVSRMVSLPSLKTLHLLCVRYSFERSKDPHLVLSNFPVLEELLVKQCENDNVRAVHVNIASLKSLSVNIAENCVTDGFVIDCPSLRYFKVVYYNSNHHYCLIENMPKLEEADLDVLFPSVKNFMEAVTSVKSLSLCLSSHVEAVYSDGIVFKKLEHLKLCTCETNWSNFMFWVLKESPKLRVIELYVDDEHACVGKDPFVFWKNQQSYAPEYLFPSLETFKWTGFNGAQEARDLVILILKNAYRLKTAKILTESGLDIQRKLEIRKELSLSYRASTICQIAFD
ncbi:unnamed protein product [Microthlaspi erraticum]|uniref:F-box domain-containing protein n=1 Tax=Microthlaspi erraticum TaxID=1685480 RepID=A0A6D2KZN7_9BRAS|nr:unnamed protein product [Microthlaspi erraticum]